MNVDEGTGTATMGATLSAAPTDGEVVFTLSNGATVTFTTAYIAGTTVQSTSFAIQGDDVYIDGATTNVTVASYTGGAEFENVVHTDTADVVVSDTIDEVVVTLTATESVDVGGEITYTATVPNAPVLTPLIITITDEHGTELGTVTIAVGETTSTDLVVAAPDAPDDSYDVTMTDNGGGLYENLNTTDGASTILNQTLFPGGLAYSIGGKVTGNNALADRYDEISGGQNGEPSVLYTIDLESGDANILGVVEFDFTDANDKTTIYNSAEFYALSMDPELDTNTGINLLWGIANVGSSSFLVSINPVNAEVFTVTEMNSVSSSSSKGLSFSAAGELYLYDGHVVSEVDIDTGVLTTVFTIGGNGKIDGLAVHPETGDFYYIQDSGNLAELFIITAGTAALGGTIVGTSLGIITENLAFFDLDGDGNADSFDLDGISFDNYGNLWGVDSSGNLLRIDEDSAEVVGAVTAANSEMSGAGLFSIAISINEDEVFEGNGDNDIITGGSGSDILTGGGGDDIFIWTESDNLDIVPDANGIAEDIITDFEVGLDADVLDLGSLLIGEHDGSGIDDNNLDTYLSFSLDSNGDTQIDVDIDGATDGTAIHQTITLEGVDLVTNGGGTFTDVEIINKKGYFGSLFCI